MISMVKAFVPRYRYDQLMRLGWKVFLPISLVCVVVVAGVLEMTGWGGQPIQVQQNSSLAAPGVATAQKEVTP